MSTGNVRISGKGEFKFPDRISGKGDFWKFTVVWNAEIPHFHQSTHGNSPFFEICCALFPSQHTWKLSLSALPFPPKQIW